MSRSLPSLNDRDVDMIDGYLEHLRRRSSSQVTIQRRREVLTQLNRDLPKGLGRTCRDELERWLHGGRTRLKDGTDKPWSQNTKASYFTAIKSAYQFWADPRDPWISDNPTVDMTQPGFVMGVARPVDDDELWTILDRAREPFKTWALIAAYQGLRCIELSGLDREHVTEEKLIVVRGKGGKPRLHDTDALVWQHIKDRPAGPLCRDIWLRERASAPYISQRAGKYFRKELGLTGVTMHRFRHWLGVHVQEAFKDVRVTQEMLGHAALSSTQIYTRATLGQQRAARSMLPRPCRDA
jgi:integrase/recombinase XerC